MGIAQPAIMAAGHHSIQQSNDYVNLKDEHLKQSFKKCCMQVKLETPLDAASNASY
jgi:hypothetical protein